MNKYEALKEYFGYDGFKPGQEAVIDRLLSGGDALCVMPTGAGKSLCYQIPALLLPGVTLVISPLISLMRDQVDALLGSGVPAAYINSTLDAAQYRAVLERLAQGRYKLIYVAPERLDTPGFLSALACVPISLVAVDEAHCVSQWGQDFRPSYLKIPDFVAALPERPAVGAFTATATRQVSEDIERLLALCSPLRMATGYNRPNLYFGVLRPDNKDEALLKLLMERRARSGIVYCTTRKNVETLCDLLNRHGIAATRYHAGLDDGERQRNQEDFLYDRKTVMVATNAFGMGIDKSNVGFVIHYQIPKDLESYYQEAGRAGRDGTAADCILLYSPRDVHTCRYLIEHGNLNPELDEQAQAQLRERELARLKAMTYYATASECLRTYILHYFGEKTAAYCGNCSNCEAGFERVDITLEAQKIISCVVKSGQRYGISMLCDILRGSGNARIAEAGLDRISPYGIMEQTPQPQLRRIFDVLLADGVLRQSDTDHPVILLTPKAAAVVKQGERVEMKLPVTCIRHAETGSLKAADEGLYGELKRLRLRLSTRASLPAYAVFSDATLLDMCRKLPRTREQLLAVSGVGRAKLARFGAPFLKCIREYCEREIMPRAQKKEPVPAGGKNRPWDAREDAQLRQEALQKLPVSHIARAHGRTGMAVIARMQALGLIEK
mgnify:CR=1 FL=1